MEGNYYLLKDLSVIAVASTAAAWFFSILRLPLLLGFIAVGIILSPVLDIIHEGSSISQLGQLGVLFMMFFVGLEFDPERLKRVIVPSVLGCVLQICTMGAVGMYAAETMGLGDINGLFLGGILSMSSTIVVVEILASRGDLSKKYAQLSVGVLILEDLVAIFLLVILAGLAEGQVPTFTNLAGRTIVMLTFVVSMYIVGKFAMWLFIDRYARKANPQVQIMFAFALIMGLGGLAAYAGLSLALGAFLAGSILSGSDVSERIGKITNPFRNLFVALFFVSVGTMIEPKLVGDLILPIAQLSITVILLQSVAVWAGMVFGGASCRDALKSATINAQLGEFGFVIAGLGITLNVADPSLMVIAMGVALITIFVNPLISNHADNIADFVGKISPKRLMLFFQIYRDAIAGLSASENKVASLRKAARNAGAIVIYMLLFNAMMVLTAYLEHQLPDNEHEWTNALKYGAWVVAAILSLPLLIGTIRNLEEAVAIFMSFSVRGNISGMRRKITKFIGAVFTTFLILFFAGIFFVVAGLYMPSEGVYVLVPAGALVVGIVFWRFFAEINGVLEYNFGEIFRENIENAENYRHEKMMENIRKNYSWAPDVREVRIHDDAESAGMTLKDLDIRRKTGSDIVAIKRGRFIVYNVMGSSRLFPDDLAILSGDKSSNDEAESILKNVSFANRTRNRKEEISISTLELAEKSPLIGKTLAELPLAAIYMIKVLGWQKNGEKEMCRPNIHVRLSEHDKIIAMSSRENLEKFKADCWLV